MAEQATGWGETASLQRHNAAARSDHSSCERPWARPSLDPCGSRILSAADDLDTSAAVMPLGCQPAPSLFLPSPGHCPSCCLQGPVASRWSISRPPAPASSAGPSDAGADQPATVSRHLPLSLGSRGTAGSAGPQGLAAQTLRLNPANSGARIRSSTLYRTRIIASCGDWLGMSLIRGGGSGAMALASHQRRGCHAREPRRWTSADLVSLLRLVARLWRVDSLHICI